MVILENLPQLLRETSNQYPYRTAIIFGLKKISYNNLNVYTDKIAAGLIKSGIKPKDRVALLLDNCPEFVIAYYAILKAGAVVVPINYMFKADEARYVLQDSKAVCIITSRVYLDLAMELRTRVEPLQSIITTTQISDDIANFPYFMENEKEFTPPKIKPEDTAVILYTSGTTGYPKGAMLTHHNLISNAIDCSRCINVTRKDTFICILPLFHSFAATVCMNLPLLVGARIVIMKSVRPFKRVLRAIRKNRVSIFVAVPSIYNILKDAKLPKILPKWLLRLLNPIRVCVSGAASLPVDTFHGFEKKFAVPLLEGYGLTEASPVVTLNPIKGPRKAGSIGVPISERLKLRIVGESGNDCKAGEIGELLVKGPSVMKGYWDNVKATDESIKDGWLYTGDMAKRDEDNYFYIVGRKKEMVNVRGLNVYPREIEEVLYHNPKIKEAAVIGVPDAHKGEVPKGFVVLIEGQHLTEHEIIQYLREHLAPYKIPKYVEIRSELPKGNTGKILKRVLSDEEARRKQS